MRRLVIETETVSNAHKIGSLDREVYTTMYEEAIANESQAKRRDDRRTQREKKRERKRKDNEKAPNEKPP